jgi:hypothetical protein
VRVDRRPVDGLVACAAGPRGVATAVTKAGFVADEGLAQAEPVAVGAVGRWAGHPLAVVVCTSSPTTN